MLGLDPGIFFMTNIEKYYNKFHEEHRLTTRHGQVEFRTTLHYIEEAIRWLSDAERRIETDYDWKSVKNRADRVGLGLSILKVVSIRPSAYSTTGVISAIIREEPLH